MPVMTPTTILELVVAIALIAGAIILYRRRSGGERGGSQSAVMLLVIGVIMLIHGLGLLEYRPSTGEIEAVR